VTTFFMFGKYSPDAIREISTERTQKALDIIKNAGGEVKSMHALLGVYDLVVIAEFPGVTEALKASVGLNMVTGISFTTTPALPAADFDKMVSEI
jgi:uncharacterized protein with GYD domain